MREAFPYDGVIVALINAHKILMAYSFHASDF